MNNPILRGSETVAYRDPACIYAGGVYRLFFTLSVKKDGYMYNSLALSESKDLEHWSEPRQITRDSLSENYCSPGNILCHNGEYLICVSSYPMPLPFAQRPYADETARLYFIRTADFVHFSSPELIRAKGDVPMEDMGRMIDPYVFRDRDDPALFHLFFKQNGVSHAHSRDLQNWVYDGHIDGGENACVVLKDGIYHLFHSPANGIGHKISRDLITWEDCGIMTLEQDRWDWAQGRLTAGFVMEHPQETGKYLLFFHGSRRDVFPETHGEAVLGLVVLESL